MLCGLAELTRRRLLEAAEAEAEGMIYGSSRVCYVLRRKRVHVDLFKGMLPECALRALEDAPRRVECGCKKSGDNLSVSLAQMSIFLNFMKHLQAASGHLHTWNCDLRRRPPALFFASIVYLSISISSTLDFLPVLLWTLLR